MTHHAAQSATIARLTSIWEAHAGFGNDHQRRAFDCGRTAGPYRRTFYHAPHPRHAHEASGLCVLFIGLGGTMQKMLVIDGKALATTGTTMLIVSFALGSLIGEAINLEAGIENLGEWLKRKTGSEGDNEFTNAFVSTSLTVCIGAMAIVDQSKTACSATGPRSPSKERWTASSSAP